MVIIGLVGLNPLWCGALFSHKVTAGNKASRSLNPLWCGALFSLSGGSYWDREGVLIPFGAGHCSHLVIQRIASYSTVLIPFGAGHCSHVNYREYRSCAGLNHLRWRAWFLHRSVGKAVWRGPSYAP